MGTAPAMVAAIMPAVKKRASLLTPIMKTQVPAAQPSAESVLPM